jgi:hypothetical protein
MIKQYLALLLIVPSLVLGSQFSDVETAARPLGLASAYTALAEGVDAIRYNPAGIALIPEWEVGSSYKHKWSGISGLHSLSLGFVKGLGDKGNVGVHVTEFGASIEEGRYSETTATLSYAHSLTSQVYMGMNLNLFYLQVPEPDWAPELGGTAQSVGLDFGLLAKFHPAWSMGFFAQNVNQTSIKGRSKSYELPGAVAFGLAFSPTETAVTSLDIRKERHFAARLSLGQEVYLFDNNLGIRGGLMREDELTKFAFGFDAMIGPLNLGYSALAQPDLPLSHVFSLQYRR